VEIFFWATRYNDGLFVVFAHSYEKARAKLENSTKGPPKGRLTPAQEKTIWSGLLAHLKKEEGLPVVAFTLSRKRCDMRAQLVASMESAGNLTSGEEKHKIRGFVFDCMERLSKQDRDLPQVRSKEGVQHDPKLTQRKTKCISL